MILFFLSNIKLKSNNKFYKISIFFLLLFYTNTYKKMPMSTPKKKKDKFAPPEILPQSDDFALGTHPREQTPLFGHRKTAEEIVEILKSGRVPQSMIFLGSQGIGKATFVYHLIRLIERHKDDFTSLTLDDFYNEAKDDATYRRISQLTTGNLKILRRNVNEKTGKFYTAIRMEDLKDIRSFFTLAAHGEGYRYCVIDCLDDCVHGENKVPNALLKTLEEPPAKTIFFIIAHNEGSILPTIKSRSTIFKMASPAKEDMENIIQNMSVFKNLPLAQKTKVIAESSGSVRRALIFTDNVWLELSKGIKNCLLKSVPPEQVINKMSVYNRLEDKKFSSTQFLEIMHIIFLGAISSFMRYSVKNTPKSSALFFQTELYEKTHNLFIEAEKYNFFPKEVFEMALHILVTYHYERSQYDSR